MPASHSWSRPMLWSVAAASATFMSAVWAQNPPPPPQPADPAAKAAVDVSVEASADSKVDAQGDVLTRGPVHEAFAEVVQLSPVRAVVVKKEPPQPIEESPPDQRPEGENITWISGYWAWDDELDNFIWISGTWRASPPDMVWVPGYWTKTEAGYMWTPGSWMAANTPEQQYLPEPPTSKEAGPTSPAPGPNYVWAPGSWTYVDNQYQWRPGYWYAGHDGWVWIPNRMVWTPSGYIYANGYWDYDFARRGLLFAPIAFNPGVYTRPNFVYTPRIAVSVSRAALGLFVRPTYRHYYFGDYYADSYVQSGFQPLYTYYDYRTGYDPILSYYRWQYRDDAEWYNRLQANFQYRQTNGQARPPRTYAALVAARANVGDAARADVTIAAPLTEFARLSASQNVNIRLSALTPDMRDQARASSSQLREIITERQRGEIRVAAGVGANKDPLAKQPEAQRWRLPRSAIGERVARQPGEERRPTTRDNLPLTEQPATEPKTEPRPQLEPSKRPPAVEPKPETPQGKLPPRTLPNSQAPQGKLPPEPDPETPKSKQPPRLPEPETPKGKQPPEPNPEAPKGKLPEPPIGRSPPRPEPPTGNPPKAEPPTVGPPKAPNPPKVDPPKVDPPKAPEPPKANPPKLDPPRPEPPKVAPPKVDVPRPDPPKAGS